MNWLDFVILAIVAWFTLTAYLSGLIRETVGLAAVVVGVVLAGLYHDELSENLDLFVNNETATKIGAFLGILVVVTALGWMASLFLRKVASALFLGWADHAAGAAFGFIKGVLIIQAVAVIFVLQPALGMEDLLANSAIGSFFLDTTPLVRALLPDEFDSAIRDFTA